MVSLLCYSDETAGWQEICWYCVEEHIQMDKARWKEGSLNRSSIVFICLPCFIHLGKSNIFDSSIFPVLRANMIQMKKKEKTKNPTTSLKTESAPERPTFAGAFPVD